APERVYRNRAKTLKRLRILPRRPDARALRILEVVAGLTSGERFGHVEAVDASFSDNLRDRLFPRCDDIGLPEWNLTRSLDDARRIRPIRRAVVITGYREGLRVHRRQLPAAEQRK